jgi:hypothetical protein
VFILSVDIRRQSERGDRRAFTTVEPRVPVESPLPLQPPVRRRTATQYETPELSYAEKMAMKYAPEASPTYSAKEVHDVVPQHKSYSEQTSVSLEVFSPVKFSMKESTEHSTGATRSQSYAEHGLSSSEGSRSSSYSGKVEMTAGKPLGYAERFAVKQDEEKEEEDETPSQEWHSTNPFLEEEPLHAARPVALPSDDSDDSQLDAKLSDVSWKPSSPLAKPTQKSEESLAVVSELPTSKSTALRADVHNVDAPHTDEIAFALRPKPPQQEWNQAITMHKIPGGKETYQEETYEEEAYASKQQGKAYVSSPVKDTSPYKATLFTEPRQAKEKSYQQVKEEAQTARYEALYQTKPKGQEVNAFMERPYAFLDNKSNTPVFEAHNPENVAQSEAKLDIAKSSIIAGLGILSDSESSSSDEEPEETPGNTLPSTSLAKAKPNSSSKAELIERKETSKGLTQSTRAGGCGACRLF